MHCSTYAINTQYSICYTTYTILLHYLLSYGLTCFTAVQKPATKSLGDRKHNYVSQESNRLLRVVYKKILYESDPQCRMHLALMWRMDWDRTNLDETRQSFSTLVQHQIPKCKRKMTPPNNIFVALLSEESPQLRFTSSLFLCPGATDTQAKASRVTNGGRAR